MNDFTKAELEQLIWLAKNIPYRMEDYLVYDKIKSMIDNYKEECPTCGEYHE